MFSIVRLFLLLALFFLKGALAFARWGLARIAKKAARAQARRQELAARRQLHEKRILHLAELRDREAERAVFAGHAARQLLAHGQPLEARAMARSAWRSWTNARRHRQSVKNLRDAA